MMSLRFLSSLRRFPPYLKQSALQVHTSVVLLNSKDSSSSSSSSDSSDSDSDKEEQKINIFDNKIPTESSKDINETLNTSDINERLNNLLNKINEAAQKKKLATSNTKPEIDINSIPNLISNTNNVEAVTTMLKSKTAKTETPDKDTTFSINKKTVNLAIKPKSIRFGQISKEEELKQKPHEYQIKQAAKDIAESLGGDKQKTELELLTKALNLNQESLDILKEEGSMDLSGLLSKMKVDTTSPNKRIEKNSKNFKMAKNKFKQFSIGESVLYKKSITKPKSHAQSGKNELNTPVQPMGILNEICTDNKDELQLPTWNTLEKREIRLAELTVPQNVFQELIQWTNEGKIWHFPIDNEQGMEVETNVHFSEHVFMERHLKDWCPKKGPIRHFMELVCTGLSKNAYMTVEEKVGHITWYKNYFEDKKELLHELGVLDNKVQTGQKQIEA
ncbi:small ribosomal subunit protein mS31 [Phymastichus coffea]|uniref:small ribosomal subunit protein mS31 n=1 Tax=Phymastichus coffea TaxID=108790 RepID=UPI00273BE741|nr:small ribosomal subunit protein mS31 [Phymastichus coffea]